MLSYHGSSDCGDEEWDDSVTEPVLRGRETVDDQWPQLQSRTKPQGQLRVKWTGHTDLLSAVPMGFAGQRHMSNMSQVLRTLDQRYERRAADQSYIPKYEGIMTSSS